MANDKDTKKKQDVIKIKFLKCPTGAYQLAYNEGDEVEVSVELAKELIDAKFASAVIE